MNCEFEDLVRGTRAHRYYEMKDCHNEGIITAWDLREPEPREIWHFCEKHWKILIQPPWSVVKMGERS